MLYRTDLEDGFTWHIEDIYILDYKARAGCRHLHLIKFPHEIADKLNYHGCPYTQAFMNKLETVQRERAETARDQLLQSMKSLLILSKENEA